MCSVTVVVPIYGNEKYLERCLDSIQNQTLKSIEVILASDGPVDCDSICETFSAKDKRFKILKRPGGYGRAVNLAIQQAEGEYIGIVESDDWVDKQMFFELYDLAKVNEAEVCKCSFFCAFDDTKKNFLVYNDIKTGLLDFQTKTKLIYYQPSIWSAIYKKTFIVANNIFLIERKLSYVDVDFHYKTTIFSSKFYFLCKPLYFYYQDNPKQSIKSVSRPIDGLLCEELFYREQTPELLHDDVYNALLNALVLHIKWNYQRISTFQDKYSCISKGKDLLSKYFSDSNFRHVVNAAKPFYLLAKLNCGLILFDKVIFVEKFFCVFKLKLNFLKWKA